VGNCDANWRARTARLCLTTIESLKRRKVKAGNLVQRTATLQPFNEIMFQIVFNELSAAEISALPKRLQLELLAEFQILPEDLDQLDAERFGVIEREGKKLYRYRAKNYRIYFAKTDEGVKVHRVLHKNTLRDFLFRSKLPISEDAQLGETREFWKMIEEGERTPKA
jgi:mRNA-degrading endonuclease RelE of RelBE toxin-antitoxin system